MKKQLEISIAVAFCSIVIAIPSFANELIIRSPSFQDQNMREVTSVVYETDVESQISRIVGSPRGGGEVVIAEYPIEAGEPPAFFLSHSLAKGDYYEYLFSTYSLGIDTVTRIYLLPDQGRVASVESFGWPKIGDLNNNGIADLIIYTDKFGTADPDFNAPVWPSVYEFVGMQMLAIELKSQKFLVEELIASSLKAQKSYELTCMEYSNEIECPMRRSINALKRQTRHARSLLSQ